MKTTKVALIAVLCALTLFFCRILYVGIENHENQRSGISLLSANAELILEQEISPEDIESLTVQYDGNSNSVYFYDSPGENIIIKEYGNDANAASKINQNNGHLTIRGSRRSFTTFLWFNGYQYGYTEIYLPADFAAEISVQTSSGDIRSDRDFADAAAFSASSVSGDILLQNVSADELQISSTSGSISLKQVTGDAQFSAVSGDILVNQMIGDADISTTSGDIRILDGAGNRDINSTSGDIYVDGLDGEFDLDTTSGIISVADGNGCGYASTISGDVRICLDALTGDLHASTTSGDVSLQIPEDASFYLEFDSTSGDCRTFFDDKLTYTSRDHHAKGSYGEDTEMKIIVSTTSGDLRITK